MNILVIGTKDGSGNRIIIAGSFTALLRPKQTIITSRRLKLKKKKQCYKHIKAGRTLGI